MQDSLLVITIIGSIGFLGLIIYLIAFWLKRQNKLAKINEIKNGQGVISTWNYSPEEWRHAAENYFEIKTKNPQEVGKICFTKRYILAYNHQDNVLFELVGEKRFTKHLTEVRLLKQSPMNNLRFEVRTKTIKKDDEGNDTMEENYGLETFYAPVPKDYQIEQEKVLKYYQDFLDKTADAIAAVMPYGMGIFRG